MVIFNHMKKFNINRNEYSVKGMWDMSLLSPGPSPPLHALRVTYVAAACVLSVRSRRTTSFASASLCEICARTLSSSAKSRPFTRCVCSMSPPRYLLSSICFLFRSCSTWRLHITRRTYVYIGNRQQVPHMDRCISPSGPSGPYGDTVRGSGFVEKTKGLSEGRWEGGGRRPRTSMWPLFQIF